MNTLPSRAYVVRPPIRHAIVVRSPRDEATGVVPVCRLEAQTERPRGVAGIRGVHAAAGELPEEPRVHGAERDVPALGAGARAGDLVEHPADFGAGEVSVEDEPGTFSHERLGP